MIKTEEQYKEALDRLDQIFDAKENTAEGDEAELLIQLIENYEEQNFPIRAPNDTLR